MNVCALPAKRLLVISPVKSTMLGLIYFMFGVFCGAVAIVLIQNGFYPAW